MDVLITPLSPSPADNATGSTTLQICRAAYLVAASAFGAQTRDLIWTGYNPRWDTSEGVEEGARRMEQRVSGDAGRKGHCVALVASVPIGDEGEGQGVVEAEGERRKVVGTAIWVQMSGRDGEGDVPPGEDVGFEERRDQLGLRELWPGDEERQKWLVAVDKGLHGMRWTAVREKVKEEAKEEETSAVWVLDLCAVSPEYQGRGVAGRLVKWGVEEAGRRGGLECLTEASRMGRRVYVKYGFETVGEIDYGEVLGDEERAVLGRYGELPSNVFMRTGRKD
jgi:GNAT superfamily N-acetyltransferase